MLDVAWPELIVIGAVALVAVGPKDLPRVMHALGRGAGKVRRFMNEMNLAMDKLSREAEEDAARKAEAACPRSTAAQEEDDEGASVPGKESPAKAAPEKDDVREEPYVPPQA